MLRFGAFDADPDNLDEDGANPSGFRFTLQPDNLFLIAEALWDGSVAGKSGLFRFGIWHDTTPFPTAGGLRRGLTSIYLAADQQLYAKSRRGADGLYLFTLAGWVFQQNSAPFGYDIRAGAYWKGLCANWEDRLGIIFTYPHVGDRVAAGNSTSTESFLELTYQTKVINGWSLQGSFQYIKNPGGARGKQTRNATVLGVRTSFSF